jgi:hypothetical protein
MKSRQNPLFRFSKTDESSQKVPVNERFIPTISLIFPRRYAFPLTIIDPETARISSPSPHSLHFPPFLHLLIHLFSNFHPFPASLPRPLSLFFPPIDSLRIDLKVVVFWAASVSKTSIINRYCNGNFHSDLSSTVGAGFFTHTYLVGDMEVTFLLWNTTGEECYQSVALSLLRGTNGLILIYDLTERSSVKDLTIYLKMFFDTVQVDPFNELSVLILGNKFDIEETEVKVTVRLTVQKSQCY